LSSTGLGESQDQSKRLFRARPEFTNHRFAAGSYEVAEDERDNDRIVELPGYWDEVRDEVEGQTEIRDEGDQQQFASPWHAGIACEARHEHDAVGDERGKCACVVASAADHKPGEEYGVDRNDGAERDQEPFPPLHAPRLPAWRSSAVGVQSPHAAWLLPLSVRCAKRAGVLAQCADIEGRLTGGLGISESGR
jgi:hypothetical protein